MNCKCQQEGSANNTKLVLCDLHAREYHRRVEDMRGPDDNAIWNKAIDAAESKLVGPNGSPIDVWIKQRLALVRRG